MFHSLRRILSRFWLIIRAIRSAVYGLLMIAITWVVALPPSASEIARLDLPRNATVDAKGLRHHRMAKLLVILASEQTYAMIAAQSDTDITASELQLAIQIAANGVPAPQDTTTATGAKFVNASTN